MLSIALQTDSFCHKTGFQSMEKTSTEKKMPVMIKAYKMSWEDNDELS